MTVEPIGLVTVAVAVVCLFLGLETTVAAFGVAATLGSAAALIIGSANIQPAHAFLGFLAFAALTHRRQAAACLRALHPREPGFWLLCLVLYGLAGAYFLPRVLAGTTQIVPLGASIYEDTKSPVPLSPVSSNLTQSVYMIANLGCFAICAAIASTQRGLALLLTGILAYCLANTLFALVDLGTYATGTQFLLEPIRNAQYTLHTDVELAGMKRIAGSFTEASAFARSTMGVFGIAGTLWLCRRVPALTGTLAASSAVLLVLSTSSTGLVGAPLMLVLLYAVALRRCGVDRGGANSALTLVFAPLIVVAVALAVSLHPGAAATVRDYADFIVLDKGTSDSGIERASWNTVSLQNFFDSWGVGVGLGTVRTSSFAVALLAMLGVPGVIFYGLFAGQVWARSVPVGRDLASDLRLAARNGCIGLFLGDILVSPVIDQGLFFYVLAAVAAARPEPETRPVLPAGFAGAGA